jgi:hypothetical protein
MNEMIFRDKLGYTTRNVIILIQFLLNYWSGLLKEDDMKLMIKWLPQDMSMQMQAPVLCLSA